MKKALMFLSVLCVLVAPMVGCAKKEEPVETAVETTETSGTEMTSEVAPMSTEMTSDAAPMTSDAK